MSDNSHAAQMTLIEHLTELRKRLMVSFFAIGIGAIVCWVLYDQILEVLLRPYCNSVKPGENCDLIVTSPLEPFNVKLTVAGYGGITLAIPVVLWQIWRFIAPGLHRHERKYAVGSACLSWVVGLRIGVSPKPWSSSQAWAGKTSLSFTSPPSTSAS